MTNIKRADGEFICPFYLLFDNQTIVSQSRLTNDHQPFSAQEPYVPLPGLNPVRSRSVRRHQARSQGAGEAAFSLISPDIFDGYILTHASYIFAKTIGSGAVVVRKKESGRSSLKTLNRLKGYNRSNRTKGR